MTLPDDVVDTGTDKPVNPVCTLVARIARLRRFIETRKRIASPSAADEQQLIADLEASIAEASHHAELVAELTRLMNAVRYLLMSAKADPRRDDCPVMVLASASAQADNLLSKIGCNK